MSILSWYGVDQPEDAIEDSLKRFAAEMGFLPLTSKSNAGTCPIGMSIPMLFTKDTVGNEELMFAKLIVGGLKVEEVMNLFAIFPIDATMQDGGKKKQCIRNEYSCIWHLECYLPIFDNVATFLFFIEIP